MKEKKLMQKFSILSYGLRYKLLIAFSLMSIIPLLIIGYLINTFILAQPDVPLAQVTLILLFCIIIAWLGLYLAKGIIMRVIDIAVESKIIADGNYDRKITVEAGDEIGQIGEAVNFLTKKIKNNMSDLKGYQDKMSEINLDIQKRILVLSNLLQISEFISSSSTKLENILELILSKIAQLYEGGFAGIYLSEGKGNKFMLRASHNLEDKPLSRAAIEEGKGLLGKALSKQKNVTVDASSKFSPENQEFKEKYKCENIVAIPLSAIQGIRVLLVAGNGISSFTYTNDDIQMIRVFAEQILIALENDIIRKKNKDLEVKDDVTELFNKPYITKRLSEEIGRSRVSQRPCSFILINVDNFNMYAEKMGQAHADTTLRLIARVVDENARPIGRAGRIERDIFAMVMPEVNKKGALNTAEKIRQRIEKLELSSQKDDRITASFGISENPLDGQNAEEIFDKAKEALDNAKRKGKNRVVIAGVET